MLCSPSHHGRCRYHCPKLCTFQISFYFYFVALIPVLQRKSVISEEAPGKKREVSSFPGHIYWGENVQRVTRGISFLLEEGRLSPDTGSPDTQTRRRGRCQPPPSSARVQLLRSVSVRGRSVTSAVSFFFLLITIIIIIIIIIIFIIITNTVSHLSTPENKLIHSLSCGANLVGLTCIAFSPSPPLVLAHSLIHSFIHLSTAVIRGLLPQTHTNQSWSVSINQSIFKMHTRTDTHTSEIARMMLGNIR